MLIEGGWSLTVALITKEGEKSSLSWENFGAVKQRFTNHQPVSPRVQRLEVPPVSCHCGSD